MEKARAAAAALDGFPRHYPRFVLEQAAIAGALNPEILNDAAKATEAAAYIARRLDLLSDETERGWHGEPTPDGGLKFWREVRGVREAVAIDGALIASHRCAQARPHGERAAGGVSEGRHPGAQGRNARSALAQPSCSNAIFEWGRKGLTLQRYKGLGEMNPAAALGNHAGRERPHAAAGEGGACRRSRRSVRQADGRSRRTAPRIHPGQCAVCGAGCVRALAPIDA